MDKPGSNYVPRPIRRTRVLPPPPVPAVPNFFVPVRRPLVSVPPPPTAPARVHVPVVRNPPPVAQRFPGIGQGRGPPSRPVTTSTRQPPIDNSQLQFSPPSSPTGGRGRDNVRVFANPSRIGNLQTQRFMANVGGNIGVEELDQLENDVTDILRRAEDNMNILPGDQVAIRIEGRDTNGIEFTATVTYRNWQDIDVDTVLDELEHILVSDRTLAGELEIEVSVYSSQVLHLRGGGGKEMDAKMYAMALRRSTSVVSINPSNDFENKQDNCVYQFLLIGLAYLVQHKKIQPQPELKLDTLRCYDRLSSDNDRFRVRKKGVVLMKRMFGEDLTDENLFRAVEMHFKVQIVLYECVPSLYVIWPTKVPVFLDYPQLCGLVFYEEEEGGTGNKCFTHVDFCSRPESLLTRTTSVVSGYSCVPRQCCRCFEIYKVKQACSSDDCSNRTVPFCAFCHSCPNTCVGCCSQDCGKVVDIPDDLNAQLFTHPQKCRYCYTKLWSPRCCQLHVMVCKFTMRSRCAACNKTFHGNIPCDTVMCFFCSKKMIREEMVVHECYVQKEKPLAESDNILSYDFECIRDVSGKHIPYLCTATIARSKDKGSIESQLKTKHNWRLVRDQVVFIFWGLARTEGIWSDTVLDFWNFLEDPLLREFTCFAHNSKAYDAIIVKHYFSLRERYSVDVMRGRKVMHMQYDSLKLRFIDSTNFIPSALRNLSKDFGIEELKKGFFPHSIMNDKYWQICEEKEFMVSLPSKKEFAPNFKNGKAGRLEESELDEFYTGQIALCAANDGLWNLKEESILYCISDTLLLAECLLAFRESFMEMVKKVDASVTFDPFSYVTLPSAMMNLYLVCGLEEDTIGIIDRATITTRRDAYALFLFREFQGYGSFILEQDHVAVFERAKQIVIYAECYGYGCPRCFGKYQYNLRKRLYMVECREELNRLKSKWRKKFPFFTVLILSKHDFVLDDDFIKRIDPFLPLDPREAYKGGKVEVYKLIHLHQLSMCDYVSEYPTTLLGNSYDPFSLEDPDAKVFWPFPCGIPVQMWHPHVDVLDESIIGVVKCCILPPTHLYAPFLSHRVYRNSTYEVLYGLCRLCMEGRLWPCTHTKNEDRSFIGTWTCAEIHHAKTLGYKVLYIIELWSYPYQSTSLFRKFILPFMVEKIISKKAGLVDENGRFTEKGINTKEYLKTLTGEEFTEDQFKDAPARRTVAKLAQNSFTGKWGEIEIHRNTRVFHKENLSDVWALFHDSDVKVKFASILDEKRELIFAEYEMREHASRLARKKNDIIVAHITAYGRIMLSRLEQNLGDDIIYEDTDSAMHVTQLIPSYNNGFRTGDLELEVPVASHWVSLGRKWYTYLLPSGDSVNKLKGFTLSRKESELTDATRMIQHLCKIINQPDDDNGYISIPQMQFQTTPAKDPHQLFKKTCLLDKKVRFFKDKMKRYVDFSNLTEDTQVLNSYPFGFIEETSHSPFFDFLEQDEQQSLLVWDASTPVLPLSTEEDFTSLFSDHRRRFRDEDDGEEQDDGAYDPN